METKETKKWKELAGIPTSSEKYDLLLSYDINKKDNEIRPDLKKIIDDYSGKPINESLYGFKNVAFKKLSDEILSLKDEINGDFYKATNFNILSVNENDISSFHIK